MCRTMMRQRLQPASSAASTKSSSRSARKRPRTQAIRQCSAAPSQDHGAATSAENVAKLYDYSRRLAADPRVGRVTGHGIAGNVCRHYSGKLLAAIVVLLFIANTINIAADLAAMGASVRLLIDVPETVLTVALALTFAGSYRRATLAFLFSGTNSAIA